jgi:hypothetical protein
MSLHGMAKGEIAMDPVSVPPTIPLTFEVVSLFEVGHDPLDSSLRDSDTVGDITETNLRVTRDEQEDVSMVTQKSPGGM